MSLISQELDNVIKYVKDENYNREEKNYIQKVLHYVLSRLDDEGQKIDQTHISILFFILGGDKLQRFVQSVSENIGCNSDCIVLPRNQVIIPKVCFQTFLDFKN